MRRKRLIAPLLLLPLLAACTPPGADSGVSSHPPAVALPEVQVSGAISGECDRVLALTTPVLPSAEESFEKLSPADYGALYLWASYAKELALLLPELKEPRLLALAEKSLGTAQHLATEGTAASYGSAEAAVQALRELSAFCELIR